MMHRLNPNRLTVSDFDNVPRFFSTTPVVGGYDRDFTRATPSPDFVEFAGMVDEGDAFAASLVCVLPDCDTTVFPGEMFCADCKEKGYEHLRAALNDYADFAPTPPRAVIRPRPFRPKVPLHVREARLERRAKRRAKLLTARAFLVGFSVMPGALIGGYYLPGLSGWAFVSVALVALLTMLAALAILMLLTGILRRPRAMPSPPSPESAPTRTGAQWRASRSHRPGNRGAAR